MTELFHFIKTRGNRFLTITPPEQKTLFLSFKKRDTALRCLSYVDSYKKKHGTWPSLDMNEPKEVVTMELSPDRTSEPLYIEEKNLDDITEIMQLSNTGVLHCYEFHVIRWKQTQTINFKAQEMGLSEHDIDMYLSSLESLI